MPQLITCKQKNNVKENYRKLNLIRQGLRLLWLKDLMNVTEKLQFIDLTFRHSCLVSSSGVEARNEGTRQKCRNVGSMNCNFSITIIKSLNRSSIKPCLIIMCVSAKCY